MISSIQETIVSKELLLGVIMVVAVLLYYGSRELAGYISSYQKKKIGKIMIQRAKEKGILFYQRVRLEIGIIGICTKEDYLKYIDKERVLGEIRVSHLLIFFADKSFVRENKLDDVAFLEDLTFFMREVVHIVTGINPATVSTEDYETALKELFSESSELWVPDPKKDYAPLTSRSEAEAIMMSATKK